MSLIEQIKEVMADYTGACPTTGSYCGSLRSHNLTLFVRPTVARSCYEQREKI